MELKQSSKNSKNTIEEIDIEALEGLVDEYGDSIDPENTHPKDSHDLSQPPNQLSVSPVISKPIPQFEKRDYEVSEMRTFIMDSKLHRSGVSDLVCFELQREQEADRQKILYSKQLDKFYQLQVSSNESSSMFVSKSLFREQKFHLLTPYNAFFLAICLVQGKAGDQFQTLDQLLKEPLSSFSSQDEMPDQDSQLETEALTKDGLHSILVNSASFKAALEKISDKKDFGGESAFKISREKVIAILLEKQKVLVAKLTKDRNENSHLPSKQSDQLPSVSDQALGILFDELPVFWREKFIMNQSLNQANIYRKNKYLVGQSAMESFAKPNLFQSTSHNYDKKRNYSNFKATSQATAESNAESVQVQAQIRKEKEEKEAYFEQMKVNKKMEEKARIQQEKDKRRSAGCAQLTNFFGKKA